VLWAYPEERAAPVEIREIIMMADDAFEVVTEQGELHLYLRPPLKRPAFMAWSSSRSQTNRCVSRRAYNADRREIPLGESVCEGARNKNVALGRTGADGLGEIA
jgi:hypothetical protein